MKKMEMHTGYVLKQGVSLTQIKFNFIMLNLISLFPLFLHAQNINNLWFPFTGIFIRAILLEQNTVFYYSLALLPVLLMVLMYVAPYAALCFVMVIGKNYYYIDHLLLVIVFFAYFIYVDMEEFYIGTFHLSFCIYSGYKSLIRSFVVEYVDTIDIKHPNIIYLLFILYFLLLPFIEFLLNTN